MWIPIDQEEYYASLLALQEAYKDMREDFDDEVQIPMSRKKRKSQQSDPEEEGLPALDPTDVVEESQPSKTKKTRRGGKKGSRVQSIPIEALSTDVNPDNLDIKQGRVVRASRKIYKIGKYPLYTFPYGGKTFTILNPLLVRVPVKTVVGQVVSYIVDTNGTAHIRDIFDAKKRSNTKKGF